MQRSCAGGVLWCTGNPSRILLGKRAPDRASYPNAWDVPGGHCEPGETPKQTRVREFQEKIGITPTAWELLGELQAPGADRDESLLRSIYAVTSRTETPHNRQPKEHVEIARFTIDDACGLALAHPGYPGLFRRLA